MPLRRLIVTLALGSLLLGAVLVHDRLPVPTASPPSAASTRASDSKPSARFQPLSEFGFSDNTLADMSAATQARHLAAVAKVTGPGGIVRTSIQWDPYLVSGPAVGRIDKLVGALYRKRLVLLPGFHLVHQRHSVTPQSSPGGLAGWMRGITRFVNRYQPGGTYAKAHPGFPGITRFEVWNEPNTPTGNTSLGHDHSLLDPSVAAMIVQDGAIAIRQAAADNTGPRFRPQIAGFGLGGINVAYFQKLYAANKTVWSKLDVLTVHIYLHFPPDVCRAPPAHRTRCLITLPQMRAALNSHPQTAHLHLGVTEGGYSGSDDATRPTNVVTEAQQATWGVAAIKWMRAHPDLRLDFYCPSNPLDLGGRPTGAQPFWFAHLGAVNAQTMTLKPWGVAYHNEILAVHGNGS